MRLPAYNIQITISDPMDPETAVSATLENVPRDTISSTPLPVKMLLAMLEEAIEE